MGLLLSRNLANFLVSFSSVKVRGNLFIAQLEEMFTLISRTGRHLQRYDKGCRHLQRYDKGCRQVVGCIPYRYKETNQSSPGGAKTIREIEVLLISSQKGKSMMFPKGGWETDESMEDAALRETLEEAGVRGTVGTKLGQWRYKSKSHGAYHDGYMFPLLVSQQLDSWPEKNLRKRRWVTADEAKEACQHAWMKEALDVFIYQLTQQQFEDEAIETTPC